MEHFNPKVDILLDSLYLLKTRTMLLFSFVESVTVSARSIAIDSLLWSAWES